MTTPHDKALEAFTEYFVRNYPGPDTVIFDPKWHAPKLFNAAIKAIKDDTEIGSAADLISDWLGEGTEDLPDETLVRIEIGKRCIIADNLGNLRSTLHAPLSVAGKGNGWLPIETAPRDGTVIQAWHTVHKCPMSVLWKDEGFPFRGERLNWYERSYTTAWPERCFSHWRPLPAPPSTPSHEGREKA